MSLYIAKPGAACFYDTFAGPIKAVLRPVRHAAHGHPVFLDLELRETVGAYNAGEIIEHVPPRYAVPRAALKTGPCGVFRILPYTWSLPA